MFCTNCGRKLPDDISFCPFCGAAVIPKAAAVPAAEAAPVPQIPEEPVITEVPAAAAPIFEEPVAAPAIEEPIAAPVIEEPVVAAPVIEEPVAAPVAPGPVFAAQTVAPGPASEAQPAVPEPVPAEQAVEIPVPVIPVEQAPEAPAWQTAETPAEDTVSAISGVPAQDQPAADDAASAVLNTEAAEPPKKKKKGLIAAIIVVLLAAAAVGGYFIYQNLPSTKLAKLKTQINTAVESKDYNGAIDLIEQAYEFGPDDTELRSKHIECSLALAHDLLDRNEHDEFIKAADKVIERFPETQAELDPEIEASYRQLAAQAMDSGSIPVMQSVKDRLSDAQRSGRFNFTALIDEVEDCIVHTEYTGIFNSLATKLLPLIKSGDRDAVFETIRNEFLYEKGSAHKICSTSVSVADHYPLFSDPDETGKRMGVYISNKQFFFYYGDYDGDIRRGNGVWICAVNMKTDTAYREYWAEGPWSGDKPNGTFTISQLSKYENTDKEQLIEGTAEIASGLFNGKVTLSYDGSGPMTGTFHAGIPEVIMTTDPNGKQANVVLISEDGSYWVSYGDITKPRGLYGY